LTYESEARKIFLQNTFHSRRRLLVIPGIIEPESSSLERWYGESNGGTFQRRRLVGTVRDRPLAFCALDHTDLPAARSLAPDRSGVDDGSAHGVLGFYPL
jgi:hypothetical protein